jgi:hypothetical protein
MKSRLLWSALFAAFLGLNVTAFTVGDLSDLARYVRGLGVWGTLATIDLLLALVVGLAWMWRDARAKQLSPYPYLLLTLATGSLGLLLYLARHGGAPRQSTWLEDGRLELRVVRAVPFSSDRVWDALSDVHAIDRFHPLLHSADALSPHCSGVGAARQCSLMGGPKLREEVVQWNEGRGYRVHADAGLGFAGRAEAAFDSERIDDDTTLVTLTFWFRPRLWPVGKWVGTLMVEGMAARVGPQILAGLEHYLRTGAKLSPRAARDAIEVRAARAAAMG